MASPDMGTRCQPASDEEPQRRRSKRLRQNSSSELSIEELFPDDMGYEADVETVQPDTYEEPESDSEANHTPKRKFFTIDEELAARMKQLGSDRSGTPTPQSSSTHRGRKRRSLHEELVQSRKHYSCDLEVTEIVGSYSSHSPARKRRKQRSSSLFLGERTAVQVNNRPKSAEPGTEDAMDLA